MKNMQTVLPTLLAAAAAVLLAPAAAQATDLKVVNVNAPKINCVFDASCKVVVTDSVGSLQFTQLGGGARLQSRTFVAKPGTPGAGTTAYLYRVDLTQPATIFTDCLSGMVLNFGPAVTLNYAPNTPAQVYVITTGGLGSVGIKSAVQTGNVIEFDFTGYLCAGATSFFFGLAAKKPPIALNATLFGIGPTPIIQTAARVPLH